MQEDSSRANPWSQAAPYWEKHRDIIRKMFAPVTEALITDTHIKPGDTVLDVGTGPGEPALSVAKILGNGRVCGIDPSPEMIAAAQRAANHEQLNVTFEIAPADKLPFEAGTFDALVSRFAAMFFPAPLQAVQECLRVLKADGRFAFAVWHLAERNPFHCVLLRAVERYVDLTPAPDSPDAFRFAVPGKLLAILNEAGAADTSERLLQFRIEAPYSVEDFWELRSQMSEKLRSALPTLSAEQAADIRSRAIEALREYSTAGGMSFPAEVLVVSGKKR